MRAIVNTSPGAVEMLQVAAPEPAAGEVRIRTAAFGICATDLVMIGGWSRTRCPAIPGHEWCGHVESVGPGVDPGLIGAFCVAENVRADGGEVGFEHPGGYGEMLVTEAGNLHLLPPHMPPAVACLIEPLAVTVRGLRRLGPVRDLPVVVIGDGPIGLLMVMLLRLHGAKSVVLVGGREERLQIGRHAGATATLSYHDEPDWHAGYARTTEAVVEATGSARAADTALRVLRRGGRLLILGDYGEAQAGFLWNDLLHREAMIIGSNASAGAWPEAVDLAVRGELPLGLLTTHEFPYDRFEEAFQAARGRDAGAVKVVVHWVGESARECPSCES